MRKDILLVATLFAASIMVSVAYAADAGEAQVTNQNILGSYEFTTADTVDIESGNVTIVALEGNMSTARWAGLAGNVTGTILLGDSTNAALYSWTATPLLIYASEAAAITWTTINGADASSTGDFPAYVIGAYSDNVTTTFAAAVTDVGAVSNLFDTVTDAPTAQTDSSAVAGAWDTYALTDGTNLLFAGEINTAGTDFRGEPVNFQMILPEDGTNNDVAATAWNVWVELV